MVLIGRWLEENEIFKTMCFVYQIQFYLCLANSHLTFYNQMKKMKSQNRLQKMHRHNGIITYYIDILLVYKKNDI